ncbi:MAG: hypothetical protein J6W29_02625, partial [Neisseriaceae bacterium]|nr:hypothetical protein [Neisseriaceae bacterium]
TTSTGTTILPNEINFNVVNNPTGKVTGLANNLGVTDNNTTVAPASPTTNLNNAATVSDVLNSGWNLKAEDAWVDFVKHADTVEFKSSDKSVKVSGSREGAVDTLNFQVNQADNHTANANGTVSAPTAPAGETQFWNATQTANAINAAAWNVQGKNGSTVANDAQAIKAGGKVDLIAGDGLVLEQSNGTNSAAFTFKVDNDHITGLIDPLTFTGDDSSGEKLEPAHGGNVQVQGVATTASGTNKNITVTANETNSSLDIALTPNVDLGSSGSLKMGTSGTNLTTITPNSIAFDSAKNDGVITGLKNNLTIAENTAQVAPALPDPVPSNNAATVSDVLNVGWNLQQGGDARDFVRHNDTVNFINGKGTTATVKTADDKKSSTIKYDVNIQEKTGGNTYVKVTEPTDTNNAYVIDDSEIGKTVTAVTDKITNAGFNLKTTASDGAVERKNSLTETGEKIKNDESVTLDASKNIKITQSSSGNVSIAAIDTAMSVADGKVTAPADTDKDKLTTAKNVADTINSVYWTAKDGRTGGDTGEQISAGDTLTFKSDNGSVKVKRTTDEFDFQVNKNDTLTITNGVVSGGVNNAYWDSLQVQNAINQSGWIVGKTAAVNGNDKLITPTGTNRVGFVEGDGVTITQDGANFTFAVKAGTTDPLKFRGEDSLPILEPKAGEVVAVYGGNTDGSTDASNNTKNITVTAVDGGDNKRKLVVTLDKNVDLTSSGSLKVGDTVVTNNKIEFGTASSKPQGVIENIATHINASGKEADGLSYHEDQAASVQDVLNSGWNIANNGENKNFVQHQNTVDFVNSETAGIVVEKKGDTASEVKVNVAKVTSKSSYIVVDGGTVKDDGSVDPYVLTFDDSAITTAIDTAVGDAKFTLTSSNNATPTGKSADIKNGSTVTIDGGDNIVISQTDSTITVATAKDVKFDSVETGNLKVTGNTTLQGNATYNGPITQGDNIVNKNYVDAGRTAVTQGTNVQVTSSTNTTTGQTTYTVDANDTKVIAGKGVSVTGGDLDNNNVREYTVAVDTTNLVSDPDNKGRVKAEQNGDKFATAENVATAINSAYWTASDGESGDTHNTQVRAGDTVTFKGKDDKVTVENTNGTFEIGLSDDVLTTASLKPLRFGGDTGAEFDRNLGDTVRVVGAATTAGGTNKNITVNANNTANQLEIALNPQVDLGNSGSLTIGGVSITKDGLNNG